MDYSEKVADAVAHFWRTRLKQGESQGTTTGVRDTGGRRAVTGGAQLDGFIELLASILEDAGLPQHTIHKKKKTALPGYFRPTKAWDLVVVVDGQLLASIEFKSHVGPSFGNNFNNRVEEALGSAKDILTAYREGAFKPSQKPWMGWLMLLEDAARSQKPTRVSEPHFKVLKQLKKASYAKRYELFCERLVRERLYDAACLILSDRNEGMNGSYSEPNPEISFRNFATSLRAHALAFVNMREG
ncbi:restriction endonuclease [Candidatus Saccharibacteria bacterium]|nr:restriction endonuclease [Candidatus Saccharibacteria bacterium]